MILDKPWSAATEKPPSMNGNHAPQPVIQVKSLTRFFGERCAVDSLTFDVPRGCVFAFIGRNGAGKTTTIRMILGLLEPTRGSSSILGCDSRSLSPSVRTRIGYMAEGHPVYGWMRVDQCEGFQRGFYEHWNHDIFASVIDYFSIEPRTRSGHLSHGQRAGLHLAMTLAIEPDVLMLDDPATGLDPAARRSLLEAMIYFTRSRERTIFFSTHLLDDVERVADRVAVLDHSVLRACASVDVFREHVAQFSIGFSTPPPHKLPDIPGQLRQTTSAEGFNLIISNVKGQTRRILDSLGADFIEEQPISLEDALIAYVGRQGSKDFFSMTGATP